MQQHGKSCVARTTPEDLLALKPDYLVEAASPAAMKEFALPALKNGTSIVTLYDLAGILTDPCEKFILTEFPVCNIAKFHLPVCGKFRLFQFFRNQFQVPTILVSAVL